MHPRDPPPPQRSQNVTAFFSENGHVAYYIIENDTCNNMQAMVVLKCTLDPWGGVERSKHFFLKVVILQKS